MHLNSAALIEEAARLHGRGALAEAASRYRQVLEGEPAHAAALYHLAVIACQQGRLDEGIALARRSLASDPQQPRAQNMLGMALSRCGEHQAALASFEHAIALAPELADAHGNRGGVLMELGRVPEAVASYQRAVALQDSSIGDLLNLGTALHRLGRHDEAIASYDRALALQPRFPEALCNRGHVLAHVGRNEEALASYDRALALAAGRRYPDALTGRARVLLDLGRIEGALVNLEEVLAQAPDQPGVAGRLVHALIARGEIARALTAVTRVLAHNETQEAKALFVECVKNRRLTADFSGVRAWLLRALEEPWDRPADLAGPAVSLVKLDPAIMDCCTRAAAVWPKRLALDDLSGRLAAIADDQLLRGLLETVPVCDVALERCLTGMRAILLDAAGDSPGAAAEDGLLRFFCALARQGFINEYVFDATSLELQQVRLLRERIVRAISSGGTVPVLGLVAVAAYMPLHSLPGAESLLGRVWSPAVAALLTQQVREPQQERSLRPSIPALTAIVDDVSRKVRDQYEDNPYPRWVKTAPKGEAKTIAQHFGSWLVPSATDQQDAVDILVAGCGTGQNLVETARQFKGARVLAVDLSLASLCYAKRQALALGLSNIDFAQADILGLADLGRSFDVVDASGVLHHISNPLAAWQLLLSLLRPGGFMRVGLTASLRVPASMPRVRSFPRAAIARRPRIFAQAGRKSWRESRSGQKASGDISISSPSANAATCSSMCRSTRWRCLR